MTVDRNEVAGGPKKQENTTQDTLEEIWKKLLTPDRTLFSKKKTQHSNTLVLFTIILLFYWHNSTFESLIGFTYRTHTHTHLVSFKASYSSVPLVLLPTYVHADLN